MTIGERLRWLRQKRNMTLRDVMCFTGLSVSHLSEIERGRAKPSFDALESLARCYGITVSQLLIGVGPGRATPLGPRCTRVACRYNTGYMAAPRLDMLENLRCQLPKPTLQSDGRGGLRCQHEWYSTEVSPRHG